MPSRFTPVLLLFVLLSACQFSEDRYARRTIRPDELYGTWRATEYAIKSLRDVGHNDHLSRDDHEIVLRPDGTCSVKTVFNVSLTLGPDPDYRVYEAGCKWHLGDVGHEALQFELTPPPRSGNTYFYFAEEDGRLIIWQYATDPDAWRYLEFERTGAAPNNRVNLTV